MSYLSENLIADEEIKTVFSFHWINYASVVLFALVSVLAGLVSFIDEARSVTLPMTGVFFVFTLYLFLVLKTTEQALTSKRVIIKSGIISRNTEEMRNSKVETVELKQGIFGRILGYADIRVTGTGVSAVRFRNIKQPTAAKNAIEEIVL